MKEEQKLVATKIESLLKQSADEQWKRISSMLKEERGTYILVLLGLLNVSKHQIQQANHRANSAEQQTESVLKFLDQDQANRSKEREQLQMVESGLRNRIAELEEQNGELQAGCSNLTEGYDSLLEAYRDLLAIYKLSKQENLHMTRLASKGLLIVEES